MSKFLMIAYLILGSTFALAGSLEVSIPVPQGLNIGSISAVYTPRAETYFCMRKEYVEGQGKIKNKIFKGSVKFQKTKSFGGCPKILIGVQVSFEVSRQDGPTVFTDRSNSDYPLKPKSTYPPQSLYFDVDDSAPSFNIKNLSVMCPRNDHNFLSRSIYNGNVIENLNSRCQHDELPKISPATKNVLKVSEFSLEPLIFSDGAVAESFGVPAAGINIAIHENSRGMVGPHSVVTITAHPGATIPAIPLGRYQLDEVQRESTASKIVSLEFFAYRTDLKAAINVSLDVSKLRLGELVECAENEYCKSAIYISEKPSSGAFKVRTFKLK